MNLALGMDVKTECNTIDFASVGHGLSILTMSACTVRVDGKDIADAATVRQAGLIHPEVDKWASQYAYLVPDAVLPA